jgi:8-oxo-dGTP pyrophosphatase MutT (NUDIX family)
MPENAKTVYKSEYFEIFRWKQQNQEGETEVIERIIAPDATTIVPCLPDGRLILLEEKDLDTSFLSFPGGKIEPNEKILDCGRRELNEETGYDSSDIVIWNSYPSYERVKRQIHILIARNCYKKSEQQLLPSEEISLNYIEYDKVLDYVNNEKFRNRILLIELLRMQLDKTLKSEFEKLLFPK